MKTMSTNQQTPTEASQPVDVSQTAPYQYEMTYQNGECHFAIEDPEVAVIHHLFVPEQNRNDGVGSTLLQAAIQFIQDIEDPPSTIHAQIGRANGATKHVLESHGFETSIPHTHSELEVIEGRATFDELSTIDGRKFLTND